jgi:F-box and leucine-rich repeat protein 10/11
MIRPQRRSARASAQKANDPSPPSKSQSKTPSKTDGVDLDAVREQEDLEDSCPACKPDVTADLQGAKESWIGCDACKAWFHWRCAGNGEDMELINKWSYHSCLFLFEVFLLMISLQVLRVVLK